MVLNGRLPDSDLGTVQIGGRLRKDLVRQTDQLALAFYLDRNERLIATDTYRDIDDQWTLYRRYLAGLGAPAAYPGQSNHGWGQAIDFASDINHFGSASYNWMKAHGPKFGWAHPDWAEPGKPRAEAWHWEGVHKDVDAPYVRKPVSGETGLGDTGTRVREIQTLLNKNLQPENHVIIDGGYGWRSAVAVVKFQTTRGLSGVGVVGDRTLSKLREVNRTAEPTIYFREGTQKHDQVKLIQAFLNKGREDKITVDGDYGSETSQAVRAFQRKHGLNPVGVIGEKTLAIMKRLGLVI